MSIESEASPRLFEGVAESEFGRGKGRRVGFEGISKRWVRSERLERPKDETSPSEENYFQIIVACEWCRLVRELRLVTFSVGAHTRRRANICEACVEKAENIIASIPAFKLKQNVPDGLKEDPEDPIS